MNDDSPPSYTPQSTANPEIPPLDSEEDYVVVDPERIAVDNATGETDERPPEYSNVSVDTSGSCQPVEHSRNIENTLLNAAREKELLRQRDETEHCANSSSGSGSIALPIVKHFVQSTDTLYGLSLKYNVAVSDLRKANRLFDTDEVVMRTFIYIPSVAQSLAPEPRPDDIKVQLIRQFQLNTECRDGFEAKTYLNLNDWDLAKAVESYHSDMHWERRRLDQGESSSLPSFSKSR